MVQTACELSVTVGISWVFRSFLARSIRKRDHLLSLELELRAQNLQTVKATLGKFGIHRSYRTRKQTITAKQHQRRNVKHAPQDQRFLNEKHALAHAV